MKQSIAFCQKEMEDDNEEDREWEEDQINTSFNTSVEELNENETSEVFSDTTEEINKLDTFKDTESFISKMQTEAACNEEEDADNFFRKMQLEAAYNEEEVKNKDAGNFCSEMQHGTAYSEEEEIGYMNENIERIEHINPTEMVMNENIERIDHGNPTETEHAGNCNNELQCKASFNETKEKNKYNVEHLPSIVFLEREFRSFIKSKRNSESGSLVDDNTENKETAGKKNSSSGLLINENIKRIERRNPTSIRMNENLKRIEHRNPTELANSDNEDATSVVYVSDRVSSSTVTSYAVESPISPIKKIQSTPKSFSGSERKNDRYCMTCKVYLPNLAWNQHINSPGHQFKLKLRMKNKTGSRGEIEKCSRMEKRHYSPKRRDIFYRSSRETEKYSRSESSRERTKFSRNRSPAARSCRHNLKRKTRSRSRELVYKKNTFTSNLPKLKKKPKKPSLYSSSEDSYSSDDAPLLRFQALLGSAEQLSPDVLLRLAYPKLKNFTVTHGHYKIFKKVAMRIKTILKKHKSVGK